MSKDNENLTNHVNICTDKEWEHNSSICQMEQFYLKSTKIQVINSMRNINHIWTYTLSFMPSSWRNEQYSFRNSDSFSRLIPSFLDGERSSISSLLKYHLRIQNWGSSSKCSVIGTFSLPNATTKKVLKWHTKPA